MEEIYFKFGLWAKFIYIFYGKIEIIDMKYLQDLKAVQNNFRVDKYGRQSSMVWQSNYLHTFLKKLINTFIQIIPKE